MNKLYFLMDGLKYYVHRDSTDCGFGNQAMLSWSFLGGNRRISVLCDDVLSELIWREETLLLTIKNEGIQSLVYTEALPARQLLWRPDIWNRASIPCSKKGGCRVLLHLGAKISIVKKEFIAIIDYEAAKAQHQNYVQAHSSAVQAWR